MLRYLAPVMAFVFVATAVGFGALWNADRAAPRIGAAAMITFCVAVNASSVLSGPNGIIDTQRLLDDTNAQQESILEIVPESGLVITRRLDKVLFPHRTTVTASYLVTSTPASSGVRHLYDTLPTDEELIEFVLSEDERPIFISNDANWVGPASLARLQRALRPTNKCFAETELPELFEISVCPTRATK